MMAEDEVILTKSEVILHFATVTGETTYFQTGDQVEPPERHIFAMPRLKHNDMGNPEIITITVQPGDHLNKEE